MNLIEIERIPSTANRRVVERRRPQKGAARSVGAAGDWRQAVPELAGPGVTLREVQPSDASTLAALLSADEVTRFIALPPATVEGFEAFVRRAHAERAGGRSVCFAVVPDGFDTAVGLFQVRQLDPDFDTAEWGFALASPFWGSGMFAEAAGAVLEFVFGPLGVRRLEARAAVGNGRGNGALRKLGAVCEGTLRRAMVCHGRHVDQHLWALLDDDWRAAGRDTRDLLRAVN